MNREYLSEEITCEICCSRDVCLFRRVMSDFPIEESLRTDITLANMCQHFVVDLEAQAQA